MKGQRFRATNIQQSRPVRPSETIRPNILRIVKSGFEQSGKHADRGRIQHYVVNGYPEFAPILRDRVQLSGARC
ncbi:MAG: hypothetical protein B7X09_03825 [Acidiphilium sp. 21-66-27]|nr:MAG: hypothetical protein B7X09_03825 [Acidiphilium sp. 21-66-27]